MNRATGIAAATLPHAMPAHASGPSIGDVVIVNDGPVLAALTKEQIQPQDARERGRLRFHGEQGRVKKIASLIETMSNTRL